MTTYVITGGTSGIGLATAKLLLEIHNRQNDTCTLIITGTNQDRLDNALTSLNSLSLAEDKVLGYLCDSGNMEDISHLANQLHGIQTHIDGLFINAGIPLFANFTDTTEEMLDKVMSVNFKGAFFTIQKLLPMMQTPCSVALTSSIVTQKAFAGNSGYTASKAALESLAGVLNAELASRGIRINSLLPGVTDTPIFARGGMNETDIASLKTKQTEQPLGRMLSAKEVAQAAVFLLLEKSIGMKNAKLKVDGGFTL